MFRKILVLLLGIALLVSVTPVSAIPEEEAAFNALLETQAKSNELYTALLLSYTQDGEIVYPDYYAGAYANEQGNMVVMVTALTEDVKNEVIKTVGSDEFIFEEAKYSYNYLWSIVKQINDYSTNNYKKSRTASLITTVGVCNNQNIVVVGLEEVSPEAKNALTAEAFRGIKVSNEQQPEYLPLKFEKRERAEGLAGSVNCGSELRNQNGVGISAGFQAQVFNNDTYSWENGFITCGHGLSEGDILSYNGIEIGIVNHVENFGWAHDYSTVQFLGGHSYTTKVVHSNGNVYMIQGSTEALEHTYVHKRGYASGSTSGYVTLTNQVVNYGQGTKFGMTLVEGMQSSPGDSGGVVYTIYSETIGIAFTAGIIVARGSNFSYYLPANTILGKSNYVRYRF